MSSLCGFTASVLLLCLCSSPIPSLAQTPKNPASLDSAWQPLLQRLVADGFEQTALETLFARMGPQSYTPAYMGLKITELYGVPGIGINRENSPPPIIPEGYTPPVNGTSVGSCLAFIQEHAAILADIEKKYGVQAPVILAILLVETGLGQDLG
jgi:membrane-bound lytic murein transglycosylase B